MSSILSFKKFVNESLEQQVDIEETLFIIDGFVYEGDFTAEVELDYMSDEDNNGRQFGGWSASDDVKIIGSNSLIKYTSPEAAEEIRTFVKQHQHDWIYIMSKRIQYSYGSKYPNKEQRIQSAFRAAIWAILDKYPATIEITDPAQIQMICTAANTIINTPLDLDSNFEPKNSFAKEAQDLAESSAED